MGCALRGLQTESKEQSESAPQPEPLEPHVVELRAKAFIQNMTEAQGSIPKGLVECCLRQLDSRDLENLLRFQHCVESSNTREVLDYMLMEDRRSVYSGENVAAMDAMESAFVCHIS